MVLAPFITQTRTFFILKVEKKYTCKLNFMVYVDILTPPLFSKPGDDVQSPLLLRPPVRLDEGPF